MCNELEEGLPAAVPRARASEAMSAAERFWEGKKATPCRETVYDDEGQRGRLTAELRCWARPSRDAQKARSCSNLLQRKMKGLTLMCQILE